MQSGFQVLKIPLLRTGIHVGIGLKWNDSLPGSEGRIIHKFDEH